MKQLIALFLLLVAVILIAAWATNPDSINQLLPKQLQVPTKISILPTPTLQAVTKIVHIGTIEFTVEIVRTPEERAKGLSGRTELAAEGGMLFVFDKENVRPTFWMKDTYIPLDIIWIDDGKVSQITENVQPIASGTPDNKIAMYLPHEPIDHVLEVLGGTVKTNKIKVGDSVTLPDLSR